MTAQINDEVLFRGEAYSLIGFTGGDLVTAEQFGMKGVGVLTSCWRGYYATYEIADDLLYLREFFVFEENKNYQPIGGVLPKGGGSYSDLDLLVPFTGKIRIAKDFFRDCYVHMGFQHATAYATVVDLTLKDGQVLAVQDRSEEFAARRGEFKKRFESGDPVQGIYEAFSLELDPE